GGRFLVWDGTTGDPEFGGRIAQGQAFWVRATNGSPQLTIQEIAKINEETSILRKKSDNAHSVLIVEMQRDTLVDRAYLKFNPESEDAFDTSHDAVKQKNGYFNISTLADDTVQLAINNLPDNFCDNVISLSVDSTALAHTR